MASEWLVARFTVSLLIGIALGRCLVVVLPTLLVMALVVVFLVVVLRWHNVIRAAPASTHPHFTATCSDSHVTLSDPYGLIVELVVFARLALVLTSAFVDFGVVVSRVVRHWPHAALSLLSAGRLVVHLLLIIVVSALVIARLVVVVPTRLLLVMVLWVVLYIITTVHFSLLRLVLAGMLILALPIVSLTATSSASHNATTTLLVLEGLLLVVPGFVLVLRVVTVRSGTAVTNALSSVVLVGALGRAISLVVSWLVRSCPLASSADWGLLLKSSIIKVVVVVIIRTAVGSRHATGFPLVQVEVIAAAHRRVLSCSSATTLAAISAPHADLVGGFISIIALLSRNCTGRSVLVLIVTLVIWAGSVSSHRTASASSASLFGWRSKALFNIDILFVVLALSLHISIVVVATRGSCTSSTGSTSTSRRFMLGSGLRFFFLLRCHILLGFLALVSWGILAWDSWLGRGGLLGSFRGLVTRISLIKLLLRQHAIKGRYSASGLLNWETFDLGLVSVHDNHGLDFVDLVQMANFALNELHNLHGLDDCIATGSNGDA